MTTRTQGWLGVTIGTLVLAAIAWSASSYGRESCMRCGMVDRAERVGPFVWRSHAQPSAGTAWFTSVCDPCAQHEWRRVGCWRENGLLGGVIACTEFPGGHALHRVCAELGDRELARSVARQFAALTPVERGSAYVTAELALPLGPRPDPPWLVDALRAWTSGPSPGPLEFRR